MTRLRRIGRERGEVTGFETKDRTELSTVLRTKAKLKFLQSTCTNKPRSGSGTVATVLLPLRGLFVHS